MGGHASDEDDDDDDCDHNGYDQNLIRCVQICRDEGSYGFMKMGSHSQE